MNKIVLSVVLVAVVMCAFVNGHAKLVIPLAWQPNPSTSAPCGGADPVNEARATWIAGQRALIQWTVVAGDGAGTLEVLLDEKGGNFAGAGPYITLAQGVPAQSVADFPFYVEVPFSANCNSSANNLCTIRVHGENNGWTACSTVAIDAPCTDCTPPPPPPPQCKTGAGLTFCPTLNKRSIQIPAGSSPALIDAGARATFNSYTNNSRVFHDGLTSNCKKLYSAFLCKLNFPPCADSDGKLVGEACHADCVAAMSACGLNQTHAGLYPCETYPLCDGESTGVSVVPAFLMVAMAAFHALF